VYRDIVEIDLLAQIAATQALLPHLTGRDSGKLVFVSSVAGKVGVPMRTAYCAAKFGLAGYAEALRAELSQGGVSVHVIYPGSIATDVSRNALTGDGSVRGRSDATIDNGITPDDAARSMLDAVAEGQREIIVAEGVEEAIAEMRRAPDELLDQVAGLVAAGYMEQLERDDCRSHRGTARATTDPRTARIDVNGAMLVAWPGGFSPTQSWCSTWRSSCSSSPAGCSRCDGGGSRSFTFPSRSTAW
jgi:NAD(P)-dependent dehydrogenase (short-subunit alcohol dehydrogenase family)